MDKRPSQKAMQSAYCFPVSVSSDSPGIVSAKCAVGENTYIEIFSVAVVL